jgi:hypothetical protein
MNYKPKNLYLKENLQELMVNIKTLYYNLWKNKKNFTINFK